MILLAVAGCVQDRIAQLEKDIEALSAEVTALNEEAARLEQALSEIPPPTRAVRVDNDPPGFDPKRPLPAGAQRPDIILLSIDTLRADHLGTYGYERDTSPFLDQLGAEGVVFDQAWSPTSWTLPSHTTMLSGQLPIHHGTIDDHLTIPADVPLVTTTFARAGYGTMGAVATLFVSSRYGFDRDFEHFVDFGIRDKQTNNLSTVDADHVFDHALHWAQEQPAGKPLFLFLHVYDVHYGYDAPPPFNEKFDRPPTWGDEIYKNYWVYKKKMVSAAQLEHQIAQYDEEIAWVDHAFRQFVETWRGAGRDAIIVVTSDHGEEFGERESWGHAHTLWPEQLHVPLIVHGPGIEPRRIAERVGTEDIPATLAQLAGLRVPSARGRSLAPTLLRGEPVDPGAPAVYADTSRFDSLVLRWHEPPWDLHVDVSHGMRALCNLDEDPTCATNVYRHHGEEAQAMFDRMIAWIGQPWSATADGRIEVQDGVIFQASNRKNQNLDVKPGDRFAVLPGDALVKVHAGDQTIGPWRPLGGSVPGARCPLKYDGRYTVDNVLAARTDEERAMLEQLGYLQDEEGDEGEEPGASGPIPCD